MYLLVVANEKYSYYPNGKIQRKITSSMQGPNSLFSEQFDNTYYPNDSLHTQVYKINNDTSYHGVLTYYPDSTIGVYQYTVNSSFRNSNRYYSNGLLVKQFEELIGSGEDRTLDYQYQANCPCPQEVTQSIEASTGVMLATTINRLVYSSSDCTLNDGDLPSETTEAFAFPNPASNTLTFMAEASESTVFNMGGRAVLYLNTAHQHVDIASLAPGIYYVRSISNGRTVAFPFLKI